MPDEMFGEKACAFVIPVDGETVDLDEIKNFLLGRNIAKFKLPERLMVVQRVPDQRRPVRSFAANCVRSPRSKLQACMPEDAIS